MVHSYGVELGVELPMFFTRFLRGKKTIPPPFYELTTEQNPENIKGHSCLKNILKHVKGPNASGLSPFSLPIPGSIPSPQPLRSETNGAVCKNAGLPASKDDVKDGSGRWHL